jgi:hypothetical protein
MDETHLSRFVRLFNTFGQIRQPFFTQAEKRILTLVIHFKNKNYGI